MGCDIHAFIEVKVKDSWHCYKALDIRRNYNLFSRIADCCRGDFEPVVKNKGLPNDLSVVVGIMANKWEGDAHSHTWLNLYEIKNVNSTYNTIGGLMCIDDCFTWAFTDVDDVKSYGFDDIRLVAWFDN